ncbi:hydroxymethylpyrimidine/phosphomethylpyrimidine kinase [Methanobacterium petrolearium]|nr:hydroxymethylpyrimidine/phosphomethylpyrimidine kinase [Methanobacterium petrolearium]
MIALSVAGLDPSGGAGILADVKTFNALDVYPTAVVTALTAQNVQCVGRIKPVDPDFVAQQIDMILEAEKIHYAKTGMLHSPEIVKLVAEKVKEHDLKLVVDPVMVAGSGGNLSQEDLVDSFKKYLLPRAVLTTPNIYEAQQLSKMDINNEKDAYKVAKNLGKICPTVITGGHLKGGIFFIKTHLKSLKEKFLIVTTPMVLDAHIQQQ